MKYLPLFLFIEGSIVLLLCGTIYFSQNEFNQLSGVALIVTLAQICMLISYYLLIKAK